MKNILYATEPIFLLTGIMSQRL
ncbi:uncharacterized protein METZ01_LOCUS455783, partial [marine metagenome]